MIEIIPSLLSADFSRLEHQLSLAARAGARRIHLDIMDGHFVPNLTFGPLIVEAVNRITDLHLEAHLMIENPDRYLEDFKQAGADTVIIHQEAAKHLERIILRIKQMGLGAGIALNPATSLDTLDEVIHQCDILLIMTVNPGFGGQSFIENSLQKIKRAAEMVSDTGVRIEVDGGINGSTVASVAKAGARYLVAGSAIFEQGDILTAYRQLERKAKEALEADR
ncbi:MAG: ribulose-phosphate 3-epimerase [Fidelibacterota bacterium]